jgi:hypothetical protein
MGSAMMYGVYLGLKKERDLLLALVGKDVGGKGGVAGFVKQVNDFALGPPAPFRLKDRIDRTWIISQADERRVLARVRKQGGRLRAGDLVKWLGLGFEEADRQAARLAVEYGGEPASAGGDDAEIAVVEFAFPELLTTTKKGDQKGETGKTLHERGVMIPQFTGNATREDVFIALFAAVNLGAGLLAHWLIARHLAHGARHVGWWHAARFGLGVLPVAFALLIASLMLVRAPIHFSRRARAERNKIREALVDAVIARRNAAIDLERLGVESADHEALRRVAIELEGTFELDKDGDPTKTVWRFPRLAAELTVGSALAKEGARPVGPLVFDSTAEV